MTSIVNKVIEHNSTTAGYKRRLQYGSVLKLDSSVISTLTKKMQEFEYKYVNNVNKTAAEAQKMYDAFVAGLEKERRQRPFEGSGKAVQSLRLDKLKKRGR